MIECCCVIVREIGMGILNPFFLSYVTQQRKKHTIQLINHQGRSVAVDVSIVTTTSHTTNLSPPIILGKAAENKRKDYEVSCRAHNLVFLPFIMSTLGGHDKDANTLIERLAATPKIKALYPRDPKKRIWKQLALCLLRAVSDSLLHAASCHPDYVVSSRRWDPR